mgnify:CR=1 FL=1
MNAPITFLLAGLLGFSLTVAAAEPEAHNDDFLGTERDGRPVRLHRLEHRIGIEFGQRKPADLYPLHAPGQGFGALTKQLA